MKSIDDFSFVAEAGLNEIYEALIPAMRYYETDSKQSCINFRSVLALTVAQAEKYSNMKPVKKLEKRIENLCFFLKKRTLMDDGMEKELMVVKRIGDKYHHSEDYPDLDPQKDRLTFYCAFQEILKWLISLPERIEAYIAKRRAEKAELQRKKEEQERLEQIEQLEREERIAAIAPWVLGGGIAAFIIGALIYIVRSGK
jgi:hypothetical protein